MDNLFLDNPFSAKVDPQISPKTPPFLCGTPVKLQQAAVKCLRAHCNELWKLEEWKEFARNYTDLFHEVCPRILTDPAEKWRKKLRSGSSICFYLLPLEQLPSQ